MQLIKIIMHSLSGDTLSDTFNTPKTPITANKVEKRKTQ